MVISCEHKCWGKYTYIQHDEVFNAHCIQDSNITESTLKGANSSKDSCSILKEENRAAGEVALSLYCFWSKLANRDPGTCEMTLETNLVRKANVPKANLRDIYEEKKFKKE